jgi:polar amino acid transport system substrate-binding protein
MTCLPMAYSESLDDRAEGHTMPKSLSQLLLLASTLWLTTMAHADTWVVRSDAWCPYNCAPEDKNPGYMVEILQGAARAHGHTLDYKLMPYSRALLQAQQGRITAVVGMLANNRKGFLFSEPMGVDSNCLIVKNGSPLRYRTPADLDSLAPIGSNEGYGYPNEFMQWKAKNPSKVEELAGDEVLARHARKLAANRINSFIENESVVRYAAAQVPELKAVEVAGCMAGGDPLFVGFSSKNPKAAEIKAKVDSHLATLRKSGELQKLLEKYKVKPW